MLLAGLRLGSMAWSQRRPLAKVTALCIAVVLGTPALLAVLVTVAVAGLVGTAASPVVDGVARPMAHWSVSQGYGCTGFYLEPARGDCPHFHAGIDLVAPIGIPVRAVLPGVAEVVLTGGYGLHVVVHHDGDLATLYGHLANITVNPGDRLAAGQVLGAEGSTGASTGAHLHFEVRRGGGAVDPALIFPGLFAGSGATLISTGTTSVA